jgi:hypothetical protein
MQLFEKMLELGGIHWPFFSYAFIAMLIGQVVKSSIFTKKKAIFRHKYQGVYWWAYKTLPLHPVIIGAIIGLGWVNPVGSSPPWSIMASVFYFAMAGTLSVWLYQIIKGVAKKKGLDLGELPGQETTHVK